ncbi:TPA: hypothetical protein ACVM09_002303 [Legionella pneumophila]
MLSVVDVFVGDVSVVGGVLSVVDVFVGDVSVVDGVLSVVDVFVGDVPVVGGVLPVVDVFVGDVPVVGGVLPVVGDVLVDCGFVELDCCVEELGFGLGSSDSASLFLIPSTALSTRKLAPADILPPT